MDDGEMPTRQEWLEEQEKKKGLVKPMRRNDRAHVLQGKN